MGVALVLSAPRRLAFEEYPDPPLASHQVRVSTMFSGISAGTEMATYRGSNPHQHHRWNPELRLFEKASTDPPAFPVKTWGYEQVGSVVEVGREAKGVVSGDILWGTWGHRSTHVLDDTQAARQRLPAGLDPVQGIFAHVGATALNGILDADIHLGETVAVFGQGVVGLIVTQLAKLSGATVVAVERLPRRRVAATGCGADEVLDPASADVAGRLRERTGGRGADVCIEATDSAGSLGEAIRSAAPGAVVVALGFFQGDATGLRLGEEFHHNRTTVRSSQIGSVAPALSHRWDRARLYQTVMGLQADGRLRLKELITHTIPFREAASAFALLDEHPEQALQVVLQF